MMRRFVLRSSSRSRSSLRICLPVILLALATQANAEDPVRFSRDIRAILSDTCFQCHGPDENQRKGGLRLDVEAEVFGEHNGARPVVPGKLEESELFLRISSTDPEEQMPPPNSGRKLTPRQIELVKKWIEQGAAWEKHWAFLPPVRAELPAVQQADWSRNEIDRFILARLEAEKLTPAPEADRARLIRRVTLDLTGLPPTPAEVDAYLADTSPTAYETVVDRLLQSPRYGERMAARWLDGARYADTNGYQSDGERHMWRWRDWVIEAYNSNMPFDQFTVEQIAGDLLPNPTLDQLIATGFNRNHRGNAEGGIVPEEYAVEYVVDRVDTTFTVWQGMTLGCARCHSHKFDPFTQREFYQLFAYFNNVPERGKAIKYGNSPPMIRAPTRPQQAELAAFDARLEEARSVVVALADQTAAAQTAWEKALDPAPPANWTVSRKLLAHYPLDAAVTAAQAPLPAAQLRDGEAKFSPGQVDQALDLNGSSLLDAGDFANFSYYDKFTISAWVYPRGQEGTIVSRMTDVPQGDGYSFRLDQGHLQLNLVKRWLDDAVRVQTRATLAAEKWHHVAAVYDGSRVASGITIYIDGQPQPLDVNHDDLNQEFKTEEPVRIGGGGGPSARWNGLLDDVRIYEDDLLAEEVEILSAARPSAAIAAAESRTPAEQRKLRACFLEVAATPAIGDPHRALTQLLVEREQMLTKFPTTMVMEERPEVRETHLLLRGEYDKPGERVERGVPAALNPFNPEWPQNRLGLARWLVARDNPLTARVAVNRIWAMYFGTGLVKTVEDFGSQGEPPTHPDLLDWLSVEFMESGWDVKHLNRLIVTSAAYRQSSRVTPDLLARDPDNRLLSRGPRFRLAAELIRDQALAASGLLVEKVGGPSVMPYQPEGMWKDLAGADYPQGTGEDLYRRSLYTYWKRTIAPPSMLTFDAAGRETCIVRETRTNTPLQALTLMNEVTFVEAARALAQRAIKEGGATPAEKLTYAFRLAVTRPPTPRELEILTTGLERHQTRYTANLEAAKALIETGDSPVDEKLDPAELAAYTTITGMLLNLDEVVTKE